MPIQIDFNGLWNEMPISKEECLLFFKEICLLHKIENICFEIRICDDKESRKLNNAYLGANSPTNVLSFNEDVDFESDETNKSNFIGSLALSFETLEREAFLYGQERKSYAKQLLIHGFAHLLGYDHSDEMYEFCDSALGL